MDMVQSGRRRLPLEEIKERAARVATGLQSLGVGEGSTIAILLRNDIPFIETMLAANRVGAYSVPLNWHLTVEETRYILEDSQAVVLVIHSDLYYQFKQGIPEHVIVICVSTPVEICEAYSIDPENAQAPQRCREWESWLRQYAPSNTKSAKVPGSMVYTSGTTGRCKGVKREAVAPENREASAELRRQWFGHRPGMRTAIIGPMYHSVQMSYTLAAVSAGGDVFLVPRFDAEQLLSMIASEKLTHLHLVPTMMNRILQLPQSVREQFDTSSLEFVIHGAAPCPREVKRRMIELWGPIIHEYYGTSEAGMVSRSSSEEWLQREGTVGKPWPGRTVRIYDESGNLLAPNSAGDVYMSLGLVPDFTYHNHDELRKEIERDRLITNGDIGYLDDDGYLYLCDRKHDLVISGGVNIYPAEIEAVLATNPSVFDCAVFGIPDEEFGEALAAVVQLRDGHTLSIDELKAFVQPRLARFKLPRHFEIRDYLPRDDSGKIFKQGLREPFWAEAGRRI